MFDGALGLAGDIDFAFVQALAQIIGRQVDQHHLIGGIEEGIGHRLAYLDAGYAADLSCLFEQPVRIRAHGLVGHLVFP